jgi:hypothetical protein
MTNFLHMPNGFVNIAYECFVLWLVFMLVRELLHYRRLRSIVWTSLRPEVVACADFWMQRLNRKARNPENPISEEQVQSFGLAIREALAEHRVRKGTYPDIGIYYYGPHCYGGNPLLVRCLRQAGIYCTEESASTWVPSVQIHVTAEGIQRRIGYSTSDWTTGPASDYEVIAAAC